MIGDIALFVTAIGVVGAVFGLRQGYLERLQQFESKYVDRYWTILDRLSLEAFKGRDSNLISDADRKNLRCYILLCEDEIQMRGNGYISDHTYELWADGIRTQFERQPLLEEVWRQVQDEADQNLNFPYENLRRLLDNKAEPYDPLNMSSWRKRARGLTGFRWVDRRVGTGAVGQAPGGSAGERTDRDEEAQSLRA